MLQAVLCCMYVALFIFIINKSAFFRLPGISVRATILLFLLKIITATFLWNYFLTLYPITDASAFFNDSKILYDLFFDNPSQFIQVFFRGGDKSVVLQPILAKMQIWNNTGGAFLINDSRTLIRLNTLFRFFSFGQFYVHAVFMCMLSFTGLICLYKLFYPYLRKLSFLLICACFLFPSVLFWSSTVLKEGIIFLGLGLLLYHCECGLKKKYTFKNVIGLLIGTGILLLIKVYVLLALCPALIANVWIANSSHKRILFKYATVFCAYVLLILIIPFAFPALDFAKVIQKKQTDFINVAKGGMVLYSDSTYIYLNYDQREGRLEPFTEQTYKLKQGFQYASFRFGKTDTVMIDGASDSSIFRVLYTLTPANSSFEINKIEPSFNGIFKNIPAALFNTFVLPPLFKLHKPFSSLLLLQNLFLLLFVVVVLCFFRKKQFPLALVLFCFSFVLILFCLIGLTTPVLGALVRYRIPGIPFLIIGVALMTDEQKWRQLVTKLPKLNNIQKSGYQ
jgi:hypothetical protein